MSTLLNIAAVFSSDEDLDQFTRLHIPYGAACDVAMSDDSFGPMVVSQYSAEPHTLAELVCKDISNVVYNLVNSHPNEAAQLFEELLYYRNKGRI